MQSRDVAPLTPQNLFAKSWSCTLAVRVLSVCFGSVSLPHFAITVHPLITLSPSQPLFGLVTHQTTAAKETFDNNLRPNYISNYYQVVRVVVVTLTRISFSPISLTIGGPSLGCELLINKLFNSDTITQRTIYRDCMGN